VQIEVPALAPAVLGVDCPLLGAVAAVDAPPAAVGDPADLLHVQMCHVTRPAGDDFAGIRPGPLVVGMLAKRLTYGAGVRGSWQDGLRSCAEIESRCSRISTVTSGRNFDPFNDCLPAMFGRRMRAMSYVARRWAVPPGPRIPRNGAPTRTQVRAISPDEPRLSASRTTTGATGQGANGVRPVNGDRPCRGAVGRPAGSALA
jgi:hypothetical protein